MTTVAHKFHVPVMGLGFSIDTPIKIAHYGISSVMSIAEDGLIEKIRKHHSELYGKKFTDITEKEDDFRAKRITKYLNLINELVNENFERLKKSRFEEGSEIIKYFDLLPDDSELKAEYFKMVEIANPQEKKNAQDRLRNKLVKGSADVNIMTKLDKVNYNKEKEQLPIEYNDAHAALRGFAKSNLNTSIVLSAGMNPRLFAYAEKMKDFYPNENGNIKKKIILKVSDYRSALIQGKMLAKKGLWVSEFRIESGLNCGGHAFATKGFLMGPILEEFKQNRNTMQEELYCLLVSSLSSKNLPVPTKILPLKISAQGGIGTAQEQDNLLKHYNIDATGWGTPFLLVPEVVNIDDYTLALMQNADEDDLYTSHISPLGVMFNTIIGNSKDIEKQKNILKHRPGSACPKKYLALNTEFTEKPICTASRQYQVLKIQDLGQQDITPEKFDREYSKVIEKSCICVGLGTAALLANNIETKVEGEGVSVCPGPNLAYFSDVMSLRDITSHIYGRVNMLNEKIRPHMFIKELDMYVKHLKQEINDSVKPLSNKEIKNFNLFKNNLQDGIEYYKQLFSSWKEGAEQGIIDTLKNQETELKHILT